MKSSLTKLLKILDGLYQQSDIKQYCDLKGHQWHYSLANTSFETGGSLIIGFNWGAADNYNYTPQQEFKKCDLRMEDLGSLSRSFKYFDNYFGSDYLAKASQTNYCFFRSKKESQISKKDIDLCENVFVDLLSILQPQEIICLSKKLCNHLEDHEKILSKKSKKIPFKMGGRELTYEVVKGSLFDKTKIYCLPHPNYPMKKHARDEAWSFCFSQ